MNDTQHPIPTELVDRLLMAAESILTSEYSRADESWMTAPIRRLRKAVNEARAAQANKSETEACTVVMEGHEKKNLCDPPIGPRPAPPRSQVAQSSEERVGLRATLQEITYSTDGHCKACDHVYELAMKALRQPTV